jgi:hypothetical protein
MEKLAKSVTELNITKAYILFYRRGEMNTHQNLKDMRENMGSRIWHFSQVMSIE